MEGNEAWKLEVKARTRPSEQNRVDLTVPELTKTRATSPCSKSWGPIPEQRAALGSIWSVAVSLYYRLPLPSILCTVSRHFTTYYEQFRIKIWHWFILAMATTMSIARLTKLLKTLNITPSAVGFLTQNHVYFFWKRHGGEIVPHFLKKEDPKIFGRGFRRFFVGRPSGLRTAINVFLNFRTLHFNF